MSPESIKEISAIVSSLSSDAQNALIGYYAFNLIKIPITCVSIGILAYVLIKAVASAVQGDDRQYESHETIRRFRDELRVGSPGALIPLERLEVEQKVLELIRNSKKIKQ